MFWISARTSASSSNVRRLLFPNSFVSVEVPTFTTIRFFFIPMGVLPSVLQRGDARVSLYHEERGNGTAFLNKIGFQAALTGGFTPV